MITKNYLMVKTGTLVASGPGTVTITPDTMCTWALGDSATIAPVLSARHSNEYEDNTSLELSSGEYLWVYGKGYVASTAEIPAAGDI